MLVKNPTGITQVYMFGGLTLTAGATADISNSYVEDLEFQKAQEGGTISVIKYEQDMVSNTVTIYTGLPPTAPSIEQKGALVASYFPSSNNPYITHLRLNGDIKGKVTWTSEGLLAEIERAFINSRVHTGINSTYNVLTSHYILANGESSGLILPPSSICYLYLSTIIKASIVPVINPDWILLGQFWTDENGLIGDYDDSKRHINCKYYEDQDEPDEIELGIMNMTGRPIVLTLQFNWVGTDCSCQVGSIVPIEKTGEIDCYEHFMVLIAGEIGKQVIPIIFEGATEVTNIIYTYTFLES